MPPAPQVHRHQRAGPPLPSAALAAGVQAGVRRSAQAAGAAGAAGGAQGAGQRGVHVLAGDHAQVAGGLGRAWAHRGQARVGWPGKGRPQGCHGVQLCMCLWLLWGWSVCAACSACEGDSGLTIHVSHARGSALAAGCAPFPKGHGFTATFSLVHANAVIACAFAACCSLHKPCGAPPYSCVCTLRAAGCT